MTSFSYTAIPFGRPAQATHGRLDAPSEQALRRQLESRGLLMLDATPSRGRPAIFSRSAKSAWTRRDARWFFETLSALLDGAAPLEAALETTRELAPSVKLEGLTSSVHQAMRQGATLDEALDSAGALLAPRHRALLRVGHESGRLTQVVHLIHESVETSARLRQTLIGRLIYPIVLLLVALAALWGISTIVIPRFAMTLEALGGELPLATRMTLGAGEILVWLIPGLVALAFGAILSRRHWLTPARHARLSTLGQRIPIVGPAIWNAQALALCESLGVMLEGGADLAQSIDHAQEVLDSPEIAKRFELATKEIRAGVDLGEALMRHRVLPRMTLATVRAGMEGGDLAGGLRRATIACIERHERATQRVMTLIEPTMIVGLALVILWIVYSLVSGMLAMNDLQGL